jgi:nicotinate-nucleotide pyrophosphorylase
LKSYCTGHLLLLHCLYAPILMTCSSYQTH